MKGIDIYITEDAEKIILGHTEEKTAESTGHRIAAVLIDPGHGGKDSGAIGRHKINGKQLLIKRKKM